MGERERKRERESNKKNLIIHHLLTKFSPHETHTHTQPAANSSFTIQTQK